MKEVYRAYILPRPSMDTKEPMYVERISADEGNKLLVKFKSLITTLIKDYVKFKYVDETGKVSTIEDLYDLLDEVVVGLRWSLYLDPVPRVLPSSTAFTKYVLRTLKRVLKERLKPREWPRDLIPSLLRGLLEEGALKFVADHEVEKIEDLRENLYDLLRFPADTRPAANTSSLLLHVMTTSAIASCLVKRESPSLSLEKLVALRLLALFHDIGKFHLVRWRDHEEVSSMLLLEFFDKYVDGKARELVAKVAKALASKDVKELEDVLEVVRRADAIASNIDRLSMFFMEVMPRQELSELEEIAKSMGKSLSAAYNSWDFWDKVGTERIRELSEEFAKRASRITRENPLLRVDECDVIDYAKGLLLIRLDLRGIQRYVRVEDLRSMCGASRIVDIVCTSIIPVLITRILGLPIECILYFGGGNITFIAPNFVDKDDVREKLRRELCDRLREELGIEVSIGSSPLYNALSAINHQIDSEIAMQKMMEIPECEWHPNIAYVCDFCGIEYAEESLEDSLICKTCRLKHEVGDALHFEWKIKRVKDELGLDVDSKTIKGHAMEYIAGISYEALKSNDFEEYPYIALIRFDGNMTSQIIASATSITDAVERSLRVDYALKRALNEVLEQVKSLSKEDYLRLTMGVMYIGGDDGFILAPSYLAIPIAIYMAKRYCEEMGFKSTISMGIAVAKPKHPIIELYRAAGHLLDGYAKRAARDVTLRIHGEEARKSYEFCGGLAFYVAERGMMTEESISAVIRDLAHKRLTLIGEVGEGGRAPSSYTISQPQSANSILRILRVLFGDLDLASLNIKDWLQMLIRSADNARGGEVDDFRAALRATRNDALDILYRSLLYDDSIYIKWLHGMRQSVRHAASRDHKYEDIVINLVDPERGQFPIHDLILLVKILDGDVKEMARGG